MSDSRRELGIAVVACLAGSALALLAVGRPWLEVAVRRAAPAPDDPEGFLLVARELSGRTLAPAAAGWALLALAGVVAIAATRRLGRVLTGALVFASGVIVAGLAVRVRADPLAYATDALGPTEVLNAQIVVTAWTWVAVAGGALLAATGALVAARGPRWPALGARYSRRTEPTGRPATEAEMWDAIDRGDGS